jgi:antitoxin component of RelBE/YafQ-DinJ toxin-antitoxin module
MEIVSREATRRAKMRALRATYYISTSVDEATAADVQRVARERGVSVSGAVRELVKMAIKQRDNEARAEKQKQSA